MKPCAFINLGNTCYLNTAVQALLSLNAFRLFLYSCLFPVSYHSVISLLKTCTKKNDNDDTPLVSLQHVYSMYTTLYPSVHQNAQEDAVECMLRLIECFETVTPHTGYLEQTGCFCDSIYQKSARSFLTFVFHGIQKNLLYYTCCGHSTVQVELFGMHAVHDSRSIQEYLQSLMNTKDDMSNDQCEKCSTRQPIIKRSVTFHHLPIVFMFEILQKHTSFVLEPEFLIIHTHGPVQKQYTYKLRSLCLYTNHHYFCIVCDDTGMYLADDSSVKRIDDYKLYIPYIRCVLYERM